MAINIDLNFKGPFINYLRKIVGVWVQENAYNCSYTGWVGFKTFLHKNFICEKNEKYAKFPTNIPNLSHKMS